MKVLRLMVGLLAAQAGFVLPCRFWPSLSLWSPVWCRRTRRDSIAAHKRNGPGPMSDLPPEDTLSRRALLSAAGVAAGGAVLAGVIPSLVAGQAAAKAPAAK